MPATNRYMNVSGWTHGANAITGIKKVAYDEGISTKKEGADFDLFPTFSVADFRDPKITIDTIDAFSLSSVVAGVKATLSGNVRDLYNGVTAAGGGKLISMASAQIDGRNQDFSYREYGKQSLSFSGISSDGATHPVSITAL